jgi:transcriptional regulator with XRE-family HTH domain
MASENPLAFAELLRRTRVATQLTQEELAERAGISVRAISDLERGVKHTPRKDTVRLLAEALGLDANAASAFQAAARADRLSGDPPPVPATPEPVGAPAAEVVAGQATSAPLDLPTGTVTFLLTDIEGSTSLWEQHPAAMQAAIARHDTIIDSGADAVRRAADQRARGGG